MTKQTKISKAGKILKYGRGLAGLTNPWTASLIYGPWAVGKIRKDIKRKIPIKHMGKKIKKIVSQKAGFFKGGLTNEGGVVPNSKGEFIAIGCGKIDPKRRKTTKIT